MDVLTDVLRTLQVHGSVSGCFELGGPWALAVPNADIASFHIISRGGCYLTHGDSVVSLASGDLVMFPHGVGHVLADEPSHRPQDFPELLRQMESCDHTTDCRQFRGGGSGRKTEIICAKFQFSSGERHPLLAVLPPLVLVRSEEYGAGGWMEQSLRLIASEATGSELGAQIAIDRLVDLLLVQTVRAFVKARSPEDTGWLGALLDPKIGQALQRLHEEPHRAWTVEQLACAVGMSRSGFAERFRQLVGEPPLRYLKGWRMQVAAHRFRSNAGFTVSEVARSVGYESEAAFGVAFKKYFDAAPGEWRRQQHRSLR